MAVLIWIVLFTVVEGCVFAPTYNGTVHKTINGNTCQRWDSQTPHQHSKTGKMHYPVDGTLHDAHNYCRDVNGQYELWCYTTNSKRRWEECNISTCESPDVDKAECQELPHNRTSRDCPRWTEFYKCQLGMLSMHRHILYHLYCDRYFCCKIPTTKTDRRYTPTETIKSNRSGFKPINCSYIFYKILYILLIVSVVNRVVS